MKSTFLPSNLDQTREEEEKRAGLTRRWKRIIDIVWIIPRNREDKYGKKYLGMVSWPLSRPTITPHLIPLISAFIKSWRERRGWKGGDESGRESASLIKAKQAANRCPPRIFAQEIITPPSLCIILSRTGLLERHAERREEFALAGSTRATIGVPCKSIPLLSFVRLQRKREQNGNSRFVLLPFEAKILIRHPGKNSTRDTNF